jgi:hypothetical protein
VYISLVNSLRGDIEAIWVGVPKGLELIQKVDP